MTVYVADEYTGMVKYNTGGRGMLAGIRANVDKLAELLAAVRPCLRYIQICLEDKTQSETKLLSEFRLSNGARHWSESELVADCEQRQSVVEPFRRLFDVREVKIEGVGEIYAHSLTRSMTASREALLEGFSGLSHSEL